MNITSKLLNQHNVLVIQPYVKWGPNKSVTTPELKLEEAEALVRSIPTWTIRQSVKVPLESLNKKWIFGKGKMDEIKQILIQLRGAGKPVSCIFISKGTLSGVQKRNLEQYFGGGVSIMDRYSVVIQILRLHATSMEAKLQVAMAEIPYIWSQMRDNNNESGQQSTRTILSLSDTQREMLKIREKKLKTKLENLRAHRGLLRTKRKQKNFPIVAVVGYTNAGKTSLIKALTDEQQLQPRNQLFATLDVTAHAGLLPCRLKVIYMDTVGFMSDIPTGLIECFIATLEDAMLADVIVHVQDISHNNYDEQRKHVEATLQSLMVNTKNLHTTKLLENIVNVGNKCDLIVGDDKKVYAGNDLNVISSTTLAGINDLQLEIERKILSMTNRTKMRIKVPMGGEESVWLYKNAAITNSSADPNDSQSLVLNVVISESKLQQFRHNFVHSAK